MSRQMVVYTGLAGKKMFDDAVYSEAIIKPAVKRAAGLLAKDKISEDQYENLCSMIVSPDRENLVVAIAVMEAKESNQDENRVQSRRPQLPKYGSSR